MNTEPRGTRQEDSFVGSSLGQPAARTARLQLRSLIVTGLLINPVLLPCSFPSAGPSQHCSVDPRLRRAAAAVLCRAVPQPCRHADGPFGRTRCWGILGAVPQPYPRQQAPAPARSLPGRQQKQLPADQQLARSRQGPLGPTPSSQMLSQDTGVLFLSSASSIALGCLLAATAASRRQFSLLERGGAGPCLCWG